MRLIRKARLYFSEGKSDKVYEVDLCDLGSSRGSRRYLVNFRYGRRDSALREGTKTTTPIEFDEAKQIFDSVVVSKINKGYQESEPTGAIPEANTIGQQTLSDIDPVETAILDKLERAHQGALDASEVKRVIWRAGVHAYKSCAARVADFVHQDDELLDYCIAWALGRIGDTSYQPILLKIQKRYGLNHVGLMAREAYLSLSDASQRDEIYLSIKEQLAEDLVAAINAQDQDNITTQLGTIFAQSKPEHTVLLSSLYTLARDNTALHASLLCLIKGLEIAPNVFKAMRQIFKHAEFRFDADMYARLIYRFDTTPAYYNREEYQPEYHYLPETHERVKFSKEIKKENSRLAYSNLTRRYLRQRAWRNLRKLGEIKAKPYVSMATSILLSFNDSDSTKEFETRYYNYDSNEYIRMKYGPFTYFLVFNYLLYLNSPRNRLSSKRNKWFIDEGAADIKEFRCEAFPELWDQQPEALLTLLINSGCEPVHVFAVRALRVNKSFCNNISNKQLVLLLAQPYALTIEFVLTLIVDRIKSNNVDIELVQALVKSPVLRARELGIDIINAKLDWLQDDPALFLQCLISPYEDIRLWMRRVTTELVLDEAQVAILCAKLIAHVIELGDQADEKLTSVIEDIGWILLNVYREFSRQLSIEVIEDLLKHNNVAVALVGAKLLINHATPVDQLPAGLLRQLLEASQESLRALGVQLFGQLPDEVLLLQPELLISLAIAKDAQVRQAARPIVSRLAAHDHEFAKICLNKLMNYLFRAEPDEGFHNDLLDLIQTDLNHVTDDIDENMIWRLLRSRSRAAQRYGAFLLPKFAFADFSVRQLARMAGHGLLSVREYGYKAFEQNVHRVKNSAQDALVIFDTDWDLTRVFARNYFKQHFQQSDWSPELFVNLCDSNRSDVQQFGQGLITQFFVEQNGIEYLTKLSEHPSTNVQLFASHFLQQYAAADVERIRTLLPYFINVLSQVNRARVIKNRINQFLSEQSSLNEDVARLVAYIYSRQSVTMAISDKSTYVQILFKIKQQFPGISSSLNVKPRSRYTLSEGRV